MLRGVQHVLNRQTLERRDSQQDRPRAAQAHAAARRRRQSQRVSPTRFQMIASPSQVTIVEWTQARLDGRRKQINRRQAHPRQRFRRQITTALPQIARNIPEHIDQLQSLPKSHGVGQQGAFVQ